MKKAKKPRRQYYGADGNKLPSVTTILGAAVAKPGLIAWAAKVAAEATAEALLDGFCERDVAIAEGSKAPNSKRDGAAELGTKAHHLVELHYDGEEVVAESEDAALILDCYRRAVRAIDERWEVEASEWVGVSSMGYGGTLDLVCIEKETKKRWLVDLKTGSYHGEHIAQLAAYRHLWNENNPDKPIDDACILHVPVRGEGHQVVGIAPAALDAGWDVFRAAIQVHANLSKLVFT
jgi:hypothetical protein